MSIFLLSFYPEGDLNKIYTSVNNNKKTKQISNKETRTVNINKKYKNYDNKYEELKKDLEINPFFLTF